MGAPLQCDSRQQRGKHTAKNEWFKSHGVQLVTVALPFGDYRIAGSNVVVDTKRDVQELAGNLGHDHDRFVRECDKALAAGYRLVILVEEHAEYNDRAKVSTWITRPCKACRTYKSGECNPPVDSCKARRYKPLNGPTLLKIMNRLEEKHGVRFEFCRPSQSARRICELLGMEVK